MNIFKILKTPPEIIIKVEEKLSLFQQQKQRSNENWFNELCFCLLTANSKAKTALKIEQIMGKSGFQKKSEEEIKNIIRHCGHRFHNKKAYFIIQARKFLNIKDLIFHLPDEEARNFLVKNIKGLGFKEASHFLRNVGYNNVAIIDRHILRFLLEQKLINFIPKTITKKKYLKFENILRKFKIPLDKLDLLIWFYMTGEVLK